MLELTRVVVENNDFAQIKGISFKRDGKVIKAAP